MKLKPVVIDDYNKHMLGVDKLDQFASYYSFLQLSPQKCQVVEEDLSDVQGRRYKLIHYLQEADDITRMATNDTQSVPSSTN